VTDEIPLGDRWAMDDWLDGDLTAAQLLERFGLEALPKDEAERQLFHYMDMMAPSEVETLRKAGYKL
jgi:hypothetical protein